MLVLEGLLPFLSPTSWRRDLRARAADERRPDPLPRPVSMLVGLAMLLVFWPESLAAAPALAPDAAARQRPARRRYNLVFNQPALSMSSAWLLPEHIADVLPAAGPPHRRPAARPARRRRAAIGFELVMPPLLEHLESLLSGTGHALDLQTFKLVDQLSGRTLGLRADTTPQVARIDAHLLNRSGVARLCYCGPVLHTRPDRPARDARAAAVRRRDLRPRRPRGRPRDPASWRSSACASPALEDVGASTWPTRASCARVLAGVPVDAAGSTRSTRRWPPRTQRRCAR